MLNCRCRDWCFGQSFCDISTHSFKTRCVLLHFVPRLRTPRKRVNVGYGWMMGVDLRNRKWEWMVILWRSICFSYERTTERSVSLYPAWNRHFELGLDLATPLSTSSNNYHIIFLKFFRWLIRYIINITMFIWDADYFSGYAQFHSSLFPSFCDLFSSRQGWTRFCGIHMYMPTSSWQYIATKSTIHILSTSSFFLRVPKYTISVAQLRDSLLSNRST